LLSQSKKSLYGGSRLLRRFSAQRPELKTRQWL
jgi:hypothetical protein